jgi:hypothetical protein
VISTSLLIGATVMQVEWRYRMMAILPLVLGLLTAWSIREGWKGIARLTTLILPMMFGLGAGLFTFLLPEVVNEIWIWSWSLEVGRIIGWLLRSFFWIVFMVSVYSLLLTENIFSVSAIRTIALARAANAVGFLLTLVTGFFLYNAVWSFRLPAYGNGLLVALITWGLMLQGLWAAKLEDKLDRQVVLAAVILSLVMGQIAMVFSFWPVSVAVGSLVMITMLYVLLGLYQQEILKRLFKRTMWEYVSVGLVVLMIVAVTTRWGG